MAEGAASPPARLVPRGRPLRLGGAVTALLATGALVLWMARSTTWRLGVPVGVVLSLLATLGVLDALGTFDDDEDRVARRTALPDVLRLGLPLLLSLGAGFTAVTLAVEGHIGPHLAGGTITACAIAAVWAAGHGLTGLGVLGPDPDGAPRPLHRRHGAWLLSLGAALLLPTLGSHSLLDPWETHYGEVAREMLARDDWISPWWAQDGWFWSKPVLGFWLQALAMATFGVRTGSGQMLGAALEGRTPWPEWAVRLPTAALALGAVYLLYRAVARTHGRRAGALGALVLLTMPQFGLVARQTMTDMPFVAAMTGSFALLSLGLATPPGEVVRLFEIQLPLGLRPLRLGAHHLVLGAISLTVLPQIALLVSQNVWIGDRWPPMRLVADSFSAGSPGNCGLPGNDACRPHAATFPRLAPALQAILWLQPLALVLAMSWGERRVRRLAFLGAWWCAAVATMAKGPAGAVLPLLCLALVLVLLRRHREALDLELPAGALIGLSAVLPWVVAMVARHGMPFLDRLLFHDMVKRALGHVHDTNAGEDVSFRYYLWQLGYGVFPWTGVAAVGALGALSPRRTDGASAARSSTEVLLLSWLAVTLALFSLMETKFHHYVLPALPPLAALSAIALDRWLEERPRPSRGLLLAALGAPLVLLVGRDLAADRPGAPGPARLLHLFTYSYARGWPDGLDVRFALGVLAVLGAAATVVVASARLRRHGVAALAAVAIGCSAFVLDRVVVRAAPHWGQRELVLRWIAASAEEPGPLGAYQLNWKGENFYTGNRLATFVSTGRPFREWLATQRRRGERTFYFISLHERADTLAAEVGLPARWRGGEHVGPAGVEALTTPADNARFVLLRVRFAGRAADAPDDG